MIHCLVSGTIFREVAQRTSKTGKPYVVTNIRIKDGDAQSELLLLLEGDALAQNGATKIALSIIADKVLPLKQPPKEREVKPSDTRSRRERQAGIWQP